MIEINDILNYVKEKYETIPDYPFFKHPQYAVLRNKNNKWYGLIMTIEKNKLGINEEGLIDAINLKGNPES